MKQHGVALLPSASSILRKGLLQHPAEGAVVDGGKLVLDSLDHQAQLIARRPAIEARHHVFGQHRLAVVELEPRPQPERPGEAVRRHLLGLDHLALRLQLVVHAVKRVPHQRRGVAHHVCGAPDRIEIGEIGLRHETQRARRGALRDRRSGEAAGRRQAPAPAAVFKNVRRSMMFAPRIRLIDFDAKFCTTPNIRGRRHRARTMITQWWCKTKKDAGL